jgi:hypothetical protein
MTENEIIDSLKGDFKLFLQALWEELGLPSPTRAQYAIADYLQNGPKRLQLCCGHYLMTQKERL